MPDSVDGGDVAAASLRDESPKLRIGWIMPPFVRELPVDVSEAETAAARLHALVTDLLPNHSADDQYRFALGLAAQLEPMVEADVVYAGLCLLEEQGHPSFSTIVVSRFRHDSDDEDLFPAMREAFERRYPDAEVQQVELPCGPALTRISSYGFVIGAQESPTGQEIPVQQAQIQVHIPLPDTGEMLVFALDSPFPEQWDLHSELFAEILKTIGWGTDQDVEDYRAMRQSAPAAVEPDDAVKQELYWHSSRLMDAVALRGRMDSGRQLSSVTCGTCWGKGLRSACSAQHRWHIGQVADDELPNALPRVIESFSSQGWQTETTDEGVRARAGDSAPERSAGYSFSVSVDTEANTFTAEVTSPCVRSSAAVDSLFG
ncbi:hypothetical protein [Streptomyces sp. x-80]|uniref:hypothetical protein n=1 Tax=Streptomyces sp. x-80 TaxID=2789282 RepID=UPI0039812BD1